MPSCPQMERSFPRSTVSSRWLPTRATPSASRREPGLLGRTAATAFKKFLSDHLEQLSEAETALLGAWEKVKDKKLEQSKVTAYAEKLLSQDPEKLTTTSVVRKIEYAGKIAGNIKLNQKQLKVSLNISEIDEASLLQLEDFLKQLIQKSEKV